MFLRMRRYKSWAIVFVGLFLVIAECSVILAENALHIRSRPEPNPAEAATIADLTGSSWQSVQISAADGVPLRGWLFSPPHPNGSAAILLHGVADTRRGVSSQARILLDRGFAVLTPDSRGHGVSGGSIVTYGILEAGDVHRWAGWLLARAGSTKLYGLGESLGAAILLESLRVEPRFRAVVAECPFATFQEVAFDRLNEYSHLPRFALWPLVHGGQLYARLRYGLDLREASPAVAVASTRTPVLLIHGDRDTNIPPRHSEELHALNPETTVLWEVSGAIHVAAVVTAPGDYARRVVGWFLSHP
jgi:dipeptidyl aminopeptidase/acylaminoacyl peptidase